MLFARPWIPVLVGVLGGMALCWGLYRFGATQAWELYRVFLFLLLAALLVCLTLQTDRPWRMAPLIAVGLLLLLQTALRPTLTGQGFVHASVGWITFFLAACLAGQSTKWARRLFLFLILVGGVEALLGVLQVTVGVGHPAGELPGPSDLARGSLINPSHYAGLVNMTILLTIGSIVVVLSSGRQEPRSERWAKAWILILLCASMGLGLLLSRSKGGVLSLAASLITVSVLLVLQRKRAQTSSKTPGSGLVWVLVLTILGFGLAAGLEPLRAEFRQVISAKSRLDVYRDTLDLLAERPILGVGPGLYAWHFRPHQTVRLETRYYHAHNDYLETAVEWGIPLALLFWGLVGWRFYRSTRLFLKAQDTWRKGMALGCAGGILTIMVHSLIDFNLYIPGNLMMFSAILGLSWGLERGSRRGEDEEGARPVATRSRRRPRLRMPAVVRIAAVIVVVAAGWRVVHRYMGQEAARRATGVEDLERALLWDPTAAAPHVRLARLLRDSPQSRQLGRARELLERAVALNPHDWQYRWELSRLYETLDLPEKAEASLVSAVARNPRWGLYRWRLANFYLRQGRLDRALPEFKLALALDESLAPAGLALLLKSGVTFDELDRVWPEDRQSRRTLLTALVRAAGEQLEAAEMASLERNWRRLLNDSQPLAIREGDFYIRGLLRFAGGADARRAWAELAAVNGQTDRSFTEGRNDLWNGDFELPTSQGPLLGWSLQESGGVSLRRAVGEGVAGRTALRIDFEGSVNVVGGLDQKVIVDPGARYRLSFSARGKNLIQDFRLQVWDPASRQMLAQTEKIPETDSWTDVSQELRVPEANQLLLVRLSGKRTGTGAGTLWLDAMTLRPIEG